MNILIIDYAVKKSHWIYLYKLLEKYIQLENI